MILRLAGQRRPSGSEPGPVGRVYRHFQHLVAGLSHSACDVLAMLMQPCPRRAVRRPQNKIFRPPVLAKPPVNRGKQRIYPVTIECRGKASFVKQVAKRLAGRILIPQKLSLIHI